MSVGEGVTVKLPIGEILLVEDTVNNEELCEVDKVSPKELEYPDVEETVRRVVVGTEGSEEDEDINIDVED